MTDPQQATLKALEQGVDGMPDARPVHVEAKDLRALTSLARDQAAQISSLTSDLAVARSEVTQLREQLAARQSEPQA